MRDALIAALAAVAAAQTTSDRNAAIAAALALLDAGFNATAAWSPVSSTAAPQTIAMAAQRFDSGGQVAVPVAAAAFLTASCFVTTIEITNSGSQAVTVSVWEANADYIIPPRSVPAGEMITYRSEGRRVNGGFSWQASAPGCKAYVRWQNQF